MLPVKQGEAWVQPVTEAYAVSITIMCTSSTDQPAGPPQSLAPTPAPLCTNPPRSTRKRKAKSPVPVGVASAGPANAAGPSTPGPSRGKRESKLNICFIPFC